MGYYSDVAIGMEKCETVKFLSVMSNKWKDGFLFDCYELRQFEKYDVLYWREVKWYDDDPEVQDVEEYLYELQGQEKPVAFLRLGQDLEDIEERASDDGWDIFNTCFWLNRSIGFAESVSLTAASTEI